MLPVQNIQLTLEQDVLDCMGPLIRSSLKIRAVNMFFLPYDFLKKIFFILSYEYSV